MIVENSLNEKIKHEETCTMYHNSTEVDYFTKETFTRKIQKPRMKKHTNEPITLPKPLQMRASSTLTNPFITSAENALQMLVLQMMHKILLTYTNKRMKYPNHLISVSTSFKFVGIHATCRLSEF